MAHEVHPAALCPFYYTGSPLSSQAAFDTFSVFTKKQGTFSSVLEGVVPFRQIPSRQEERGTIQKAAPVSHGVPLSIRPYISIQIVYTGLFKKESKLVQRFDQAIIAVVAFIDHVDLSTFCIAKDKEIVSQQVHL